MKKLSFYLIAILLGIATVFTSCKKDDDPATPVDLNPIIAFNTGAGFTFQDVTIAAGDSILVGVVATSNPSSGKKIESFQIYLIVDNVPQTPIVDSSGINSTAFTANYWIKFLNAVSGKFYMEITDKDGKKSTATFNIVVEEGGSVVYKFTGITLGSFNDTEFGSFYSATNDQTYFSAEAINSQELIDWCFFKGATNGNTLAAPADADAKNVFAILQDPSWTVFNETMFTDASISAEDFDAISDGDTYAFPAWASGELKANQLAIGDVKFFKLQNGKLGYFKITDFPRGDKISFDVVVEMP